MKTFSKLLIFIFFLGIPLSVFAHCPLCTVGAGALAVAASFLGVSTFSIGLFIGAFALAMGLWIERIIPLKFPYKKSLLGIVSFLLTVWPLAQLLPGYFSYYLMISGEYGSFLNRTYIVNKFWAGSVVGAIIVLVSPILSDYIQRRRNKLIPFQGIALTFLMLIFTSIFSEFLL